MAITMAEALAAAEKAEPAEPEAEAAAPEETQAEAPLEAAEEPDPEAEDAPEEAPAEEKKPPKGAWAEIRAKKREVRQKELAIETKERDAEAKVRRSEEILEAGRQQYGHLVDAKNALKLGDYRALGTIVQQLLPPGVSVAQALQALVGAAKDMPPPPSRSPELEELKAWKAQQEESQKRQAEALRAEKDAAVANTHLKGTPLEGIPQAREAFIKAAYAAFDAQRGGMKLTPKQIVAQVAKDPLVAQLVELKRLKQSTPASKGKVLESRPQPTVRLTPEQRFKASLAAADKAERKRVRG